MQIYDYFMTPKDKAFAENLSEWMLFDNRHVY